MSQETTWLETTVERTYDAYTRRPPVLSEHLRRDQLAALLATLPRHRICFGGPLAGDFNNGGGTAITGDRVLDHGQRSSPTSTVEIPPR